MSECNFNKSQTSPRHISDRWIFISLQAKYFSLQIYRNHNFPVHKICERNGRRSFRPNAGVETRRKSKLYLDWKRKRITARRKSPLYFFGFIPTINPWTEILINHKCKNYKSNFIWIIKILNFIYVHLMKSSFVILIKWKVFKFKKLFHHHFPSSFLL